MKHQTPEQAKALADAEVAMIQRLCRQHHHAWGITVDEALGEAYLAAIYVLQWYRRTHIPPGVFLYHTLPREMRRRVFGQKPQDFRRNRTTGIREPVKHRPKPKLIFTDQAYTLESSP